MNAHEYCDLLFLKQTSLSNQCNMDTREMSLDQSHLSFLVGVLVGVVMHHGLFIHGEWHKLSPNLFTSHALSVFLLILGSYVHSTKIVKVVSTVQMIFLGYVVALMMSIVLYRAFFHRLTRYGFKGPWYARVTKLWHPWAARDAKNHLLLATLHETYGDFVRTGRWTKKYQLQLANDF